MNLINETLMTKNAKPTFAAFVELQVILIFGGSKKWNLHQH